MANQSQSKIHRAQYSLYSLRDKSTTDRFVSLSLEMIKPEREFPIMSCGYCGQSVEDDPIKRKYKIGQAYADWHEGCVYQQIVVISANPWEG